MIAIDDKCSSLYRFRHADGKLLSRFVAQGVVMIAKSRKDDGTPITLEHMEELAIELNCEDVSLISEQVDGDEQLAFEVE